MSQHHSYRPEIDGLRAFAVSVVVLFHVFPYKLRGGFIGVDVFFVISGYLISRIIVNELQASKFSLAKFYIRRVRRIFPALAAVLAATMGAGWLVLSRNELEQLGKHIAAGVMFASNFVFWSESGYFDAATCQACPRRPG